MLIFTALQARDMHNCNTISVTQNLTDIQQIKVCIKQNLLHIIALEIGTTLKRHFLKFQNLNTPTQR